MTDAADDVTRPVAEEHARNTELLNAELPDKRFDGPDYLEWLYDRNPEGGGIYEGVDEDGRRMAHYALIPQRWRNAGGPRSSASPSTPSPGRARSARGTSSRSATASTSGPASRGPRASSRCRTRSPRRGR